MPPKKNQEVVIVIDTPQQVVLNENIIAQALSLLDEESNKNGGSNNNNNNNEKELEQLLATVLGVSDSYTVSSIDRDTVDFAVDILNFAASCHSNYLSTTSTISVEASIENPSAPSSIGSNNIALSKMIMTPKKTLRFFNLMFELRDFIHRGGDIESAKRHLKTFAASEITSYAREFALQKAHEDQIRQQQNLLSNMGIVSSAEKQVMQQQQQQQGEPTTTTASSTLATANNIPSLNTINNNNAVSNGPNNNNSNATIQNLLNLAPIPTLKGMVGYLNNIVANNNNNNLFNGSFIGGIGGGSPGDILNSTNNNNNLSGVSSVNNNSSQQQQQAGSSSVMMASGNNVNVSSNNNNNNTNKKGKKGQQPDPNENQAPPPLIPANQIYFSTEDIGNVIDFVANGLFQNWRLFYGAFAHNTNNGNNLISATTEEEQVQETENKSTTVILAPIVPVSKPPPLRFAQPLMQWEASEAAKKKVIADELLRLQEQERLDLEQEAQDRAAKEAAEERQRQEAEAAKLFFERHGTDLAVQHVQKELQNDIQHKHASLMARIARLEELYRIQI